MGTPTKLPISDLGAPNPIPEEAQAPPHGKGGGMP